MRRIIFAVVGIALGTAAPLIGAEIVLRFLPTSSGMFAAPVNEQSPVFHFTPNREFVWSRDWDFSIVNVIRTNNAGFVNDQQYLLDDPRPLLAVVGDSYIEAAMVPYAETLHGRLSAMAGPGRRVYSFGASGAPLSQYLVWARDARTTWRAQALVVLVIGNDFDESLARYKSGPGFHLYVENGDGSLSLKRFDYAPGWGRFLVERSALTRYLFLNLQAHQHVMRLVAALSNVVSPARAETYIGNTSTDASAERVVRSQAAVRAFLRDIVAFSGWSPERVLFAVDGARYPAAMAQLPETYFGKMRTFFMNEASERGFAVLDLDPAFAASYAASKVRFEFPTDGHWNGLGHKVAADAIAKTGFFSAWLEAAKH